MGLRSNSLRGNKQESLQASTGKVYISASVPTFGGISGLQSDADKPTRPGVLARGNSKNHVQPEKYFAKKLWTCIFIQ